MSKQFIKKSLVCDYLSVHILTQVIIVVLLNILSYECQYNDGIFEIIYSIVFHIL